jgi:alpha-galactosidase
MDWSHIYFYFNEEHIFEVQVFAKKFFPQFIIDSLVILAGFFLLSGRTPMI